MKLENKVALVTGASRGIGKAIALALAGEGADIVVNYNKSLEKARDLEREIEGNGRWALCSKADVSNIEEMRNMINQSIHHFGRIDILVNNAAVYPRTSFLDISEREWDKTIDVNLKGTFFGSQEVAKFMIRDGGGSIVNIGSNSVLRAKDEVGLPYNISKAGIVALTRDLARSLGKYGIRVNCVAPGYTSTDMAGYEAGDEKFKRIENEIPYGGVNEPGDVAKSVLYFSSGDSKNVTGQVLCVDGGMNL